MNSVHIDDEAIREKLAIDFGAPGGGARLARTLGVSPSTASLLLSGSPRASLVKAAAHYGYERNGQRAWTLALRPLDPHSVGYQRRWTALVIEELRTMMATATRPRTSAVAKRLGVSPSRLRGVMAAAHIKLRREGRS